jgi:hypothetical protein
VDIVLDVQQTLLAWRPLLHGRSPNVLAGLDGTGGGVQITLGIEIKVRDVVAEVSLDLLAAGRADRERRSIEFSRG